MKRGLFFLLFFSSVAGAQVDCGLVQKTDFDDIKEGLAKVAKPLSFMSAAVHLEIQEVANSSQPQSCSGAFISDQGEILTAAHCLSDCAEAKSCSYSVNGKRVEMEYVAWARCRPPEVIALEARRRTGENIDMRKACGDLEGQEDYAILKPRNLKDLGDFSCLALGETLPTLGAGVFTMGFPSATHRGTWQEAKDAPGFELVLSSGETVQSESCARLWNPKYRVQEWIYGGKSSEAVPFDKDVSSFVKERGMIQTTVDIVPGSSGGPLVNSKGEIVGVASVIIRANDASKECRGGTFFQPVVKLKEKLKGALVPCERRRAGAGTAL